MNFQRIKILTQDSKQIISEKELQVGELALLLGTNKLYTKNKSGEVVDLSGATNDELKQVEINYFNKSTDTLDNITAGTTNLHFTTTKDSELTDSFKKSTDTLDNILESTTNKHFTNTEKTKLSTIEENADITDAVNVGSSIHGASAKTTPIDADTVALIDSAASNVLKKLSWSNIKATLKSYFDGLYLSLSGGTITGNLIVSNIGVNKTPTAGIRADVSGVVRASTGILFGADTASANTFDDYDEGNWTPTLISGASTQPFVTNGGRYTKWGRVVHLIMTVQFGSTAFNGTQIKISGLPFASVYGSQVGILGLTARAVYQASSNHYCRIEANEIKAEYVATNAGTSSALLSQVGTFNPVISINITYITNT